MKRLMAIGILAILLCGSGYVSNNPIDEAHAGNAKGIIAQYHLDPHVAYYEQHLIDMGIIKRNP